MANLSQQRRERMLDFLQKVRDKNKDDDEALIAINEIENELTEKKYGLVWEEHSEEVEERMIEEVPVFVEDNKREIVSNGDGYNFLLEGDNLHSLYLLEKTHKEKIDVIYIDPPYNTGDNDFFYDDDYVGREDGFRHSKWLSFMSKRLRIAKKLMSNDGVMFVSIDDNELASLKPLCDSIFGEDNTDIMIWRKSGVGRDGKMKNTTTFRKDHEYIIVCFKNEKFLNKMIEVPNFTNEYKNADNDPRGEWMSGSLSRSDKASNPNHENYYSVVSPSGKTITRQFDIPKEEFERLNSDNRISWGKNGDSVPRIKIFINEERQITPYSLLLDKGTTTEGTKELNDILNGDYSRMRPKPTFLIRTLLQLGSKPNSIVLDFFAGSGTTGQAVLQLNKNDNGTRHFILCTNDQNQICTGITYPRIKTVISGTRPDGSSFPSKYNANLKYYRTDYVRKDSETLTEDLLKHIDEMIQLEYGVKIDKEKYISILTDEDANELEKNWAKYPEIKGIYKSRKVLLTAKQRDLFETKDCFTIPDYYFRNELREAGEI